MFLAAFGWMMKAQEVFSDDFDSYVTGTDVSTIKPNGGSAKYKISKITSGVIDAAGETGNGVKLTTDGSKKRAGLKGFIDASSFVKGKSYKLKASIYSTNASGTKDAIYVAFQINYSNGGSETITSDEKVKDVNTWASSSVVYDYPSDSAITKITLAVFITNKVASYDVYVDNIEVTEEGEATRISKHASYKLSVGPNPSNGLFRINSEKPITGYTVFNTTGQVIKQVNSLNTPITNVDMSGGNRGLYYIKVNYESGESQVVKALVK